MKYWLLLPLAGLLVACHHTYGESTESRALYIARSSESSQTITVQRQACTGCTATAMQGSQHLLLPIDLRAVCHDSIQWQGDVQLTGHFPFELLDDMSWGTLLRGYPTSFTVTGKVIGLYDGDGNLDGGAVPLFYVETW